MLGWLVIAASGVGVYYLLKPKSTVVVPVVTQPTTTATPTATPTAIDPLLAAEIKTAVETTGGSSVAAASLSVVATASGVALKYTNHGPSNCTQPVATIAWAPTLTALYKAAKAGKLKYIPAAGWFDPFGDCMPLPNAPNGWCVSADGNTVTACAKPMSGFGNIDAIAVPTPSRSAYYTRSGTR